MEFKFVILFLATWVLALAMAASLPEARTNDLEEEEDDSSAAESLNLLSALAPSSGSSNTYLDDANYPYQAQRENFYGSFTAPQPSFGVSINTKALLAPQVEVLRLVEAFIKLKGELLARFQALLNDNYDLIRAVLNLVLGKLTSLHSFSLKGISVIRKILEFALTVFADWNVTLPSLTLGASYGSSVQPHEVYGLPQLAAAMGK